MASTTVIALSNGASEDSISATGSKPISPPMDEPYYTELSVQGLSPNDLSTEGTSKDSILPADVSLVMPPVDAADVPLPEEECDEDDLEVSPLPM